MYVFLFLLLSPENSFWSEGCYYHKNRETHSELAQNTGTGVKAHYTPIRIIFQL